MIQKLFVDITIAAPLSRRFQNDHVAIALLKETRVVRLHLLLLLKQLLVDLGQTLGISIN